MTQLPTIFGTQYAPGRVTLGLTDLPTPPVANALPAAVTGATLRLTEAGMDLAQSIRVARANRVLTDFEVRGARAAAEGAQAAAVGPPDEIDEVLDEAFAPIFEEIEQERDPLVKEQARNAMTRDRGRARVAVGREKIRQEIALSQATGVKLAAEQVRLLESGAQTIEGAVERIRNYEQTTVGVTQSQAEADAKVELFRATATQAATTAARGFLLDQQGDAAQQWARAANGEVRTQIERGFDDLVQQFVDDGAIDGVQASQLRTGFRGAAQIETDRIIRGIVAQARNAADAGNVARLDELLAELDRTAEGISKQTALSEFDGILSHAQQVRSGANMLLEAWATGVWPTNPPQDEKSLNVAWNTLRQGGTPASAIVSWLISNRSVLPQQALQEIRGMPKAGSPFYSLSNFEDVLRNVREIDPQAAMRLAVESEAPVVGRAMWYALDGRSSHDTANASRLLGNPNAPLLLAEAGPQLEPADINTQKANLTVLLNALGANPTSEEYATILSDAKLSYLSLSLDRKDTQAPAERATAALVEAAEAFKANRAEVSIGGPRGIMGSPFDPGESYLVEKNRLPGRLDDFEGALNAQRFTSALWPFGGRRQFWKPHLVVRDGSQYYVPAVDGTAITGILGFDDATGESRLISPGDLGFEDAARQVMRGAAPESIDWLDRFRWHEGYGSRYMQEQDAASGTDMRRELMLMVEQRLRTRGALDSLGTEETWELIERSMEDEARRLGWTGIEAPAGAPAPP